MKRLALTNSCFLIAFIVIASNCAIAQSRHSAKGGDLEGTLLNVTASRTDSKTDPIKIEDLSLYENGFEQKIRNFSFDPSPSRIVLLVDNSQTLGSDIDRLKRSA